MNKFNVVFTNDEPFVRTLTHSSIMTCLARMFNPVSLEKQFNDETYAEGFVNDFEFAVFQTDRDFVGFVKTNPVTWTILVARDFWHQEPVDQSFMPESTPLSCIKECKSIFLQHPDSECHDTGLMQTIDYFIEQLSQQKPFSFSV